MRWDLDLNPIAHFPRGTILNGFRCALAIFSGKLFLIRDSETPAGVSESPFHGWGVKSSSICSTAFCESAVLRGYPFRHRLRRCHLPQGDGFWQWRESFRLRPSLEKATLENPQIFQSCKHKNILSAIYAQSERGAHSKPFLLTNYNAQSPRGCDPRGLCYAVTEK